MNRFLCYVAIVFIFTFSIFAQQTKSTKPSTPSTKSTTTTKQPAKKAVQPFKSESDKMSYVVGYDLGMKIFADISGKNLKISNDAFLRGMTDAFNGKEAVLSAEEIQIAMELFQQQLQGQQDENAQKLKEMAEHYKKEGEAFLAENAKKDSVKTTASGLQYKILREGNGKSPAETSMVSVHYRGRLTGGVVFDESYARGEPTSFKLNQVIKGWTEGLQLMKEGAKFEFYIPNNLAYGERPAGQLIPPGSMLIFEVELLEVK